jgi:hypothetical protein
MPCARVFMPMSNFDNSYRNFQRARSVARRSAEMQRLAAETNPQDHEKFADIAALSLAIDKLPPK